jgi:hypothetical protein
MADGVIAQRVIFGASIEEGNCWRCACGKISEQLLCYNSHEGKEIVYLVTAFF